LTVFTFAVDDEVITVGNVGLYLTGGQLIEADIILNGPSFRSLVPGQAPELDLKDVLVHEIGHLLGLDHTPLNNVQVVFDGVTPRLVETPVVTLRDAANIKRLVGATPTMFPIVFFVDNGSGALTGGQQDLAPDDIAGISFLYPRGSQDSFFTITSEAWTQGRSGIPSIPKPGGHVVAWCDTDNDPNTARVPLFSTLSGLYENQAIVGGRFFVYGMSKVLETMDGIEPFQATYTMTINPLNGLSFERQAPIGYTPTDFATVIGAVTPLPPVFQSEVFNEQGNLFDLAKHDAGTPLEFDRTRNVVISVDTSKTLATILAGTTPMFGDRNNVCPLNVVVAGLEGSQTPTALRGLRDRLLLKTALGTALVDGYYQASPVLAKFLARHGRVLSAAQAALGAIEWTVVNYRMTAPLALGVLVLAGWFLRRRRYRTLAAAMLLAGLCLMAMPASAWIPYLTDDDMIQRADVVVTGTVQTVSSRWIEYGGRKGIMTDITISVNDTAKGRLNKSGTTISFQQVGGRIGSIVSRSPDLPQFTEGEEVVLYLKNVENFGYRIVAGNRGTLEVSTDTATGQKSVKASSLEAQKALSESAAAMKKAGSAPQEAAGDAKIPLKDYLNYLREIVKKQQNQN
jgi:hypothetical protein